jgi:hypothetical protein
MVLLIFLIVFKSDMYESILNGSNDGVLHLGLLSFWTSSIVQYSEENSISENGYFHHEVKWCWYI